MPARSTLIRNFLPGTFLALAICASSALLANTKPKEPAPRFNAKATNGETFSNSSIKGKVVLLEFWTTWCGYCKAEAALVEKISHEYTDKDLLVLAIDVGESKKTVKKYLEQYPRTCRTFGISADMHKLPRGNENSVWPRMAAVSRRSPSKYQAAAIKLSGQAVF